MSYTIKVPSGLITIGKMDFICPACQCPHTAKDYEESLYKSKKGLIYKKCKGCKTVLGITSDMKGDTVVWIKKEEKTFN